MKINLKLLAVLLFLCGPVFGQTQPSVSQSGAVVAGHPACWFGNLRIQDCGGSPGTGTVTSVAVTGDGTIFNSSFGSPITTSGTFNFNTNLKTQTANTILAGPVSGGAAKPTFRLMVPADILAATTTQRGGVSVPANGGLFLTGDAIAISSPGTAQFGGILAKASALANNWVKYVDTSGVQQLAQPNVSDLAGLPVAITQGGTGLTTLGAPTQCLQVNGAGTGFTFLNCVTSGTPAGTSFSDFTAATTTNTVANGNNAQLWTWNVLSTQNALAITSTSITSGKLLDVEATNAGGTGYAGYFSNTATSVNAYALYGNGKVGATTLAVSGNASLSGTTTLTAAQIAAGNAALTNLTASTMTASGNAAAGLFVSTLTGYKFPDGTTQATAASTTTTAANQSQGNQSTLIANTNFVNPGFSAASPGYVILPSGIIMQWGGGTISGNTASSITFPIAFPNNAFTVQATPNSSARSYAAQVYGVNSSNFSVAVYAVGNSPFIDNVPFLWFAVGN